MRDEEALTRNKSWSVLEKYRVGLRADNLPRLAFTSAAGRLRDYRKQRNSLAALKKSAATCDNLGQVFDFVQQSGGFWSNQKRSELLSFLDLLASRPPRFFCEIGSAQGGTLFLLARVCAPEATIISIDRRISWVRSLIHEQIADRKQRVLCVRGDSGSSETIRRVKSILGGNQLDCLFIDGDHSLTGVKADFENYSPLVRPGGIIAFHDIVPDHRTRFGKETMAATGDVPTFWSTLRSKFRSEQFVENMEQDGYGLGVIFW
jgi:predicted O-methyltransferase YrrM